MNNHWIGQAVFYHIYPLGFSGASLQNDFKNKPEERLNKLHEWIPHIKSTGFNAIYFGPLFESTYHGYDTADYLNVDRRLGNNETLKNLINEFHKNDIKVILDGVFNHVGRDFFAFKEIIEQQRESKYVNWFAGISFDKRSPYGDAFTYENWNGHYNLVKLNLDNPEVTDYLFNAVKMWIEYFEIDGLRLDVADCLDKNFQRELSHFSKTIREDFWLMGEVIHGDYRKWANPGMLDSVTNYECYKGIYSSHVDKNFFEIAYSLNRLFGENGIYKNLYLYNFADNHDVDRVIESLGNSYYLYTLYILLFTIPGIPSIYYGSEFGIGGKRSNSDDKALRPSLDLKQLLENQQHPDLLKLIRRLSSIKKENKALISGDYREILVKHEQFIFERKYGEETILVAVNSSENAEEITIPFSGRFADELSGDIFESEDNNLKIKLWPNWGRIIKKI